ncbi:tyrosine-type recombinase/integrase [Candidatus Pacearchaeota archaeon]|nr:tyrosine-type recombinase/integrase [Candidatus Pacearchaeota archaeon]
MNKLITDFAKDCKARGLTHHTILTYKSNLKVFLKKYPNPKKVSDNDLTIFLIYLQEKNLAGSTLKGYFAALSCFYDYLIYKRTVKINHVLPFRKRYLSRIKPQYGGENTRQVPSVPEVRALIQEAEKQGTQAVLLIILLAKLGIRRGEALGIKITGIDFEAGEIILPGPAKRTFRTAYIDEELKAALKKWLPEREPLAKTDKLFITDAGAKMHKDIPNEIIATAAEPLGLHKPGGYLIEKLTCHCFRYFFTTELFKAGMVREHIEYLRGDSPDRTMDIYNRLDFIKVRSLYLQGIPSLLRFETKLEVFN